MFSPCPAYFVYCCLQSCKLTQFCFFPCVDLQLPNCVKLQLFFAMPEDFFLNKVVILRRFMYFEEWIIAFSGILIIHPVLLLVIITVCTCSLYWYLTVFPFPARPYYLVANQESLFGVANYAGLFCAKLFSVKFFFKIMF